MNQTIKDYLKSNWLLIIAVLLLLAIFYFAFKGRDKSGDKQNEAMKKELFGKIDILNRKIDSLSKLNPNSEKILQRMNEQDSLLNSVYEANIKLTNEVKKQHIAPGSFNHYGSPELRKYFSELKR